MIETEVTVVTEKSVEWEAEIYHDETLDIDPCPQCDGEIFSVNISHGGQVLGSPNNCLDSQKGNYHVDDYFDFELTFVRCSECNTIIYDKED